MISLMKNSRVDYVVETYVALKKADLKNLKINRQMNNSKIEIFDLQRRWKLLNVFEVNIREVLDC